MYERVARKKLLRSWWTRRELSAF